VRRCAFGLAQTGADRQHASLKGANVNDDLSATQVKKMFEVFEQTYGRRPVNQDEMVMWLKSSEYRAAIRPHLDADGTIIA
jgi:hypothetical protein